MIIVPVFFGKPIHIWLGIILAFLLTWQIYLGINVYRGKFGILKYHKWNALAIAIVALVHMFFGLGIWFFGFRIAG